MCKNCNKFKHASKFIFETHSHYTRIFNVYSSGKSVVAMKQIEFLSLNLIININKNICFSILSMLQ